MDAAEHQKRSSCWKRNLDGFPGLLRTGIELELWIKHTHIVRAGNRV